MQRPNILILYTDQQRWDALGCNGNSEIHTPNLDRLAAQGVTFDHCVVQNPVCMPSRISFLSGIHCSTLGITQMGVPVPEDIPTLPHLLKPFGYRTANIGKLHFLPHANRDHREPHPSYGFENLEISDEPGCYEDAYYAWVARQAPDQVDRISVGLPPARDTWNRQVGWPDPVRHPVEGQRSDFSDAPVPARCDDGYTHTAFVGSRTIDYLQTCGQQPGGSAQPFLCIAGFYSPHSPWVAPQSQIDRYERDQLSVPAFPPEVAERRAQNPLLTDDHLKRAKLGYYAMVSEVDDWVGRILDTLDERALSDNTVVVFTSDHGERLGEFCGFGKGMPAEDCVGRVPLIVRYPAGMQGRTGQKVSRLVEAADVVPTLLECAAIQRSPHLTGRSFADVLLGEGFGDEPHTSALTEWTGSAVIRTEGFRYRAFADGRENLWDLDAEFGEWRDVADDPNYADTLAAHRHELIQRQLQIARPRKRTWCY